jgi:hypothetical protein
MKTKLILLLLLLSSVTLGADKSSPSSRANTPPTISAIADQVLSTNHIAGPLNFTVGDAETTANKLVLSATSNNRKLVPVGNVVFGGSGSKRTVTVTPTSNQSGKSLITVVATDSQGAKTSERFLLTVNPTTANKFTPDQLAFLQKTAPTLELDRLVYEATNTIAASVTYRSSAQRDSSPAEFYLISPQTKDIERVTLLNSQKTLRTTTNPVPIQLIGSSDKPTPLDNVLQAKPGEVVLAFASYPITDASFPVHNMLSGDFALIFDPNFAASPVSVNPEVALQANEADASVNGKSLATFAIIPGAYGIGQAPINELLFFPHSQEQLDRFLQVTGGKVTDTNGSGPVPKWVTVEVTPPSEVTKYLPQFRDLYGDTSTLLSSRAEGLALYAWGLQLRLEGFQVALNPRLYFHGDAASREDLTADGVWANAFAGGQQGDAGDRLTEAFSDPVFGVREMWSGMAMWDADLLGHWTAAGKPIQVAILDMGFANNDDWRPWAGEEFLVEHDMDSAGLCKPINLTWLGKARTWHGTAVVSAAGGMLNNGVGSVGTGGQVVLPMLYCMDLYDYASHISEKIEQAVEHGADIVNFSGGYPCRFLLSLGTENACTDASRLALLAKLSIQVSTTCSLAVTTPGPAKLLWASLCTDYTAVEVFFTAFLITETKGVMENAVAIAKDKGVPVVASAGNKFSKDSIPFFVTEKDLANTDVHEWKIIPCVIPDVICVGVVTPLSPSSLSPGSGYYENQEFFGDEVDIWAPAECNGYAPINTGVTPDPAEYFDNFRQSSAGPPYICGIIANMMAINPSLHPKRTTKTDPATIVDDIATILDDTAHKPDVPEPDGTMVLPLSSSVKVSSSVAAAMDVRRNMINADKAWLAAAAGYIPDVVGLDFDTDTTDTDIGTCTTSATPDYGHQSWGFEGFGYDFCPTIGDDIGDSSTSVTARSLNAHSTPPYDSAIDEIHFIWPEEPRGLVETDIDYFKWVTPPVMDPTKMYRQKLNVVVPDYPKSLPWLSYWHGAKTPATTGTNSYAFYTPWLASGDFDFVLSTPQYTDTPYRLETVAYEEATAPSADDYENNDSSKTPTDPTGIWTEEPSTSWPAEWFESKAWVVNFPTAPKSLTLHAATDVDWFTLQAPAAAEVYLADDCAPILWIRVLPYDPNIKLTVVYPPTMAVIKEGRGSDPMPLFRRDYGLGWAGTPLLLKVESASHTTLHTYSLSLRLSIPIPILCCCWDTIVSQDFGTLDPIMIPTPLTGSCKSEPGLTMLDGSRILTELQMPSYKPGSTKKLDSEGRLRTPRTFLVRHVKNLTTVGATGVGDFWVSAFLGHDRDFAGYDQSLRMDLFSVNCQWLAGAVTLKGTTQVIDDHSGPAPVAAPYTVGDLDLYVSSLAEGSYILTLSYFKAGDANIGDPTGKGDNVDLLLNDTCIFDTSPSVQNAHDASGSPEVTIGPDADFFRK